MGLIGKQAPHCVSLEEPTFLTILLESRNTFLRIERKGVRIPILSVCSGQAAYTSCVSSWNEPESVYGGLHLSGVKA